MRVTILVLAALASCVPAPASAPNLPPGSRPTLTRAIAITPKNHPNHTDRDIQEAFALARDVGSGAVFIIQWGEYDTSVAAAVVASCRANGLTPILGLSPTSLDRNRKELDVPPEVRRRAGNSLSFSNPVVRQAFVQTAAEIGALKPPFLCLATEINFLAIHRLEEFLHFATLYKEAYREVKRVSPRTKVFVSFQWEWMRIVDSKEMDKIREHSKIVEIFRPELDLVGLTTYPAPFHDRPADLVDDYYTWMAHHVKPRDEIMLMEIGWPSTGPGSEAEQVDFIRRLPALLRGTRVTTVAWSLLHDVKIPQFGADLGTTGLVTRDGRRKPAWDAFRTLR